MTGSYGEQRGSAYWKRGRRQRSRALKAFRSFATRSRQNLIVVGASVVVAAAAGSAMDGAAQLADPPWSMMFQRPVPAAGPAAPPHSEVVCSADGIESRSRPPPLPPLLVSARASLRLWGPLPPLGRKRVACRTLTFSIPIRTRPLADWLVQTLATEAAAIVIRRLPVLFVIAALSGKSSCRPPWWCVWPISWLRLGQ